MMLLMIVIDFVRYGVSVSKLQGVSLVRCWEKGNKYFFKYLVPPCTVTYLS